MIPDNNSPEDLAAALGPMPDVANMADVVLLAAALRELPESKHPFMAYELIHNNLMQYQDPSVGPAVEMAREQGVLDVALGAMFRLFPQMATELVLGAADNCEGGTDQWNESSAGGWSQEELDKAYASIFVARDGLTIPFGSNVQ